LGAHGVAYSRFMRSMIKKLARVHVTPRLANSGIVRRLLRHSPAFAAWAAGLPEVQAIAAESPAVIERVHLDTRVGYREPALRVEVDASDEQMAQMFEHVTATWGRLGDDEPFWSVISQEQFRGRRTDERDAFFELGRSNVAELLDTLRRNGVDPSTLATCLEFGCGVGRVTWLLAGEFTRVVGCDVSSAHLDIARSMLNERSIENVELIQLHDPDDVTALPTADLVYSMIVLQHNPPPVIDRQLRHLLGRLNPGGVAVLQVPTYAAGYSFSIAEYLSNVDANHGMEMHLLPQERVFRAACDASCDMLEVFEDNWTGLLPKSASNTFVIRRR
jgi:SAM-dependent methyltransferase